MWNTVTGSKFCPVEDHGQHGQVRPRRGPEFLNPGEAQVGTTVTISRVVSGADHNHQIQVRCRWNHTHQDPVRPWWDQSHEVHEKLETLHSPGPHDVPVGTRITIYR